MRLEGIGTCHDAAIIGGQQVVAATATGVFKCNGNNAPVAVKGLSGIKVLRVVTNEAGRLAICTARLVLLEDTSDGHSIWQPQDLETEDHVTDMAADGNALIFSHGRRVSLVTRFDPLKEYLVKIRRVFDAGGYGGYVGDLADFRTASMELKSYLNEMRQQQVNAISFLPPGSLHGPQGCISATTLKTIAILCTGLDQLHDRGITSTARALQEDPCESFFSLLVSGTTTAPTHKELAFRFPVVVKNALVRAAQGSPVFDFDKTRTERSYSGLEFVGRAQPTFRPLFQTRHNRDRTHVDDCDDLRQFMSSFLANLSCRRSSRVRATGKALLGQKPRIAFLTLRQDELPSDRPLQPTCKRPKTGSKGHTQRVASITFPKNAFVGVLRQASTQGGAQELWIAKMVEDVYGEPKDCAIQWLEQSNEKNGTHTLQKEVVRCPFGSCIADISRFVDVKRHGVINIDDTVYAVLKEEVGQLEQERDNDKLARARDGDDDDDNPYAKPYSTGSEERRRRHRRR
ncbi:hypothetical protein PTSG_06861 [Salpingoeca rosetta]|uniref:Uncharacterized protein n=1 Tax=Salpingoeca rosetta (strain ATCC 50818 / BSB-021) TaxID=946362 RepID=F2UF10_SALR5|nr:uncharacterized protein PTSG_06861 [Salpingoeca rosetta]EGD75210.1 hypothetical protein PTSG_06861 [Salpingoeca rosetta]|eukprot:XP_004992263.1 hypothetical protein PTSG_06861 [Salpingoeca rosetta]